MLKLYVPSLLYEIPKSHLPSVKLVFSVKYITFYEFLACMITKLYLPSVRLVFSMNYRHYIFIGAIRREGCRICHYEHRVCCFQTIDAVLPKDLIMSPTSKKLEGHIAFGVVRPCERFFFFFFCFFCFVFSCPSYVPFWSYAPLKYQNEILLARYLKTFLS